MTCPHSIKSIAPSACSQCLAIPVDRVPSAFLVEDRRISVRRSLDYARAVDRIRERMARICDGDL